VGWDTESPVVASAEDLAHSLMMIVVVVVFRAEVRACALFVGRVDDVPIVVTP